MCLRRSKKRVKNNKNKANGGGLTEHNLCLWVLTEDQNKRLAKEVEDRLNKTEKTKEMMNKKKQRKTDIQKIED